MPYLYHMVPSVMEGSVLYPLNELKEIYPAAYERAFKKYDGRLKTTMEVVPTLGNCRWNDVLFFVAVHPAEVRQVQKEAGLKFNGPLRAYQLELSKFDASLITSYFHVRNGARYFAPFRPELLENYVNFQKDSLEYFKECKGSGRRPMIFGHVPHILYRGTVDITGVPIVEG